MGTQYIVDGFSRIACASQLLQEIRLQMRPRGYVALFVITNAGVHEDFIFTSVNH